MKWVYVVKDEEKKLVGVFSSRKIADCWANRINDHPKYMGKATVYPCGVADSHWLNTDDSYKWFRHIVGEEDYMKQYVDAKPY